ncbi:MAG TPA: Gfo/Idh/MocA family oxidoreductase [Syntrophobacter fumaroxidans]|nr:Gfo/Idh/MocA family oxidoreductase [Syntrophobacter fumaroxidans]
MKIGIIGCGKQAAKHIIALRKLNLNDITVCDIQPGMAEKLARQFAISHHKTVDELWDDQSITAIDICTPTPSHFTYAHKALSSGKHVFCEKPLTMHPDEAEQLWQLAVRQKRVGMVAFVFKYQPRFALAKEALEAGAIGSLRALYMRLGGKGSHRAWKHESENGGGAVSEMMSHMLDLLLWFMGDVAKMEVVNLDNLVKQRYIDGRNVSSHAEDFALVAGRGVNGTKFVVQSDFISQSYTNQIEIIGENGYVNLSILDSQESYIFLNLETSDLARGKTPLQSEPTDLFELMFKDFFNLIRHGEVPQKNSFRDALKLAQLFSEIKLNGGRS